MSGKFGAPPTAAVMKRNIEAPAATDDKPRFINFRVSTERFIEIKTAALHQGMPLGEYLILAHETYQKR